MGYRKHSIKLYGNNKSIIQNTWYLRLFFGKQMMNNTLTQTCRICHKDKPIEEFNKTSTRSIIFRRTDCTSCQSEYNATNYALNKERVLENQRYRRKQQKKHDSKRNTK